MSSKNNFYNLLRGEFDADKDLEISLKSTVPVFIAYPELIIPFGYRLSDVAPYYYEDRDYEDGTNLLLPIEHSSLTLLRLFSNIFGKIVDSCYAGESMLTDLPKVLLNVDIANTRAQFGVIAPTEKEIADYSEGRATVYRLKSHMTLNDFGSYNDKQKHNLLLTDILARRCSGAGLGGRQ